MSVFLIRARWAVSGDAGRAWLCGCGAFLRGNVPRGEYDEDEDRVVVGWMKVREDWDVSWVLRRGIGGFIDGCVEGICYLAVLFFCLSFGVHSLTSS